MPKRWAASVVCLVLVPSAFAQLPQSRRLAIRPAAGPVPALKYQLLPDPADLTPGNAALLYYRVYSPEWFRRLDEKATRELLYKASKMAGAELARKDLDWLLTAKVLKEMDRAARRSYCDWELTPRIREDGVNVVLPDVQDFHGLATALAARTRLYLADGRFDEACQSLQTGMAFGRDVANSPTMISALVSVQITGIMLQQVQVWIETPGSPNLYWALTDLPRPLIPLRPALAGEKLFIHADAPMLADLERARLDARQNEELMNQVVRLGQLLRQSQQVDTWADRATVEASVKELMPQARKALVEQGLKPLEVEAMSDLQAVLLYGYREYVRIRDDGFKWHDVPLFQAKAGLDRAEEEAKQARVRLKEMPMFLLLPAFHDVAYSTAHRQRRVEALRCVEAIRLYMAAHGGAAPASLADITEVPVPIDPMTGKPFEYAVAGEKATLRAPEVPGSVAASITYELSLKR